MRRVDYQSQSPIVSLCRLLWMHPTWWDAKWTLRGFHSLISKLTSKGCLRKKHWLKLWMPQVMTCGKNGNSFPYLIVFFFIILIFLLMADVKNKWENSSWGRKLIVQKRRASLNDFDRFKIMLAKIKVCYDAIPVCCCLIFPISLLNFLWIQTRTPLEMAQSNIFV